MREQGGAEIDFPALGLDFEDAADDEVADFGCITRAEGEDGEKFVGFEEGAGDGGGDCLWGVEREVGAVPTVGRDVSVWGLENRWRGGWGNGYRIH